jgi:predicted nucleotidyltransferase
MTMSTTTTPDLAEHVIATLRAHEAELRQAGIRRLSLFGSVARGEAEADSDVDLAAELDPEAGIGLFALGALERRLAELVGRKVDLLPEPVENPRLRANIDRDRRRAF